MVLALSLLTLGCAKPPEAKAPPPLRVDLPAGFDGADAWAKVTSVNLVGTQWAIDAHITQQAASGPPLRLRAELDASVEEGGALTVTNARLEPKALGEPVKGGWPHGMLATLSSVERLTEWLQRAANLPAACSLPVRKVDVHWRASDKGDRWTLSGTVDGRAVIAGWLRRTDKAATEGHIKALRWLSFSGEGCVFEQLERYDLKTKAN